MRARTRGSAAEVGFRLSLEPVWPSRIQHEIHEIAAQTKRTLRLPDIASLASTAWTYPGTKPSITKPRKH